MMEKNGVHPYFRQIYEYLVEEISSGRLAAGEKIPSEKKLCDKFNVSRITSKRALELLSDQGFIVRFPGKGSFVADKAQKQHLLSSISSRSIGFVVSGFSDSFGIKLLCGVEEACTALGYHLILKRTQDDSSQEESAISVLSGEGVAGILLLPFHGEYYNSEILKLILNKKALVFVDRKMRGLAAPTVSTDNVAATKLGVEYLLSLGHRHIAFYSGPIKNTSTIEDRQYGFIQAFADAGISHDPSLFCQELAGSWTYPLYAHDRLMVDVEVIKKHLSAHREITAAFVAEYYMALIVKSAAESLGYTIPRNFSILCFDSTISILNPPPFTYLCQDEYAIGWEAVETLHTMIVNGVSASIRDIMIPAKLIIGASTATCT
jgi:DNA-binding LacI/PurR family transcriptional regulator